MKAIKIPCEHDLLSGDPNIWATAVMRCKSHNPYCGSDGYCHLGGSCFANQELTREQAILEVDRKSAIEAERLRIEQEAKAKHDAEIAEAKKREADQAHKKQVCDSILIELGKLGIGEEIGKELIKAIHAKKIPNVTLVF